MEGEWWRFITPVFLHIGFLHLAMNTLALYYLGMTVERIFGNVRFLFIYLFAGVTGFIASFIFSQVYLQVQAVLFLAVLVHYFTLVLFIQNCFSEQWE